MIKIRTFSDRALWSNYLFFIPLALLLYAQIYWHAGILLATIITSLIYHHNRERKYKFFDRATAIMLMTANFILCVLGGLDIVYVLGIIVLSIVAFYFLHKEKGGEYALNHSLWHLASACITVLSVLIFLR